MWICLQQNFYNIKITSVWRRFHYPHIHAFIIPNKWFPSRCCNNILKNQRRSLEGESKHSIKLIITIFIFCKHNQLVYWPSQVTNWVVYLTGAPASILTLRTFPLKPLFIDPIFLVGHRLRSESSFNRTNSPNVQFFLVFIPFSTIQQS